MRTRSNSDGIIDESELPDLLSLDNYTLKLKTSAKKMDYFEDFDESQPKRKRKRRSTKRYIDNVFDDEAEEEPSGSKSGSRRKSRKEDTSDIVSWSYTEDRSDTDYEAEHVYFSSCDETNNPSPNQRKKREEVPTYPIELGINPYYIPDEMCIDDFKGLRDNVTFSSDKSLYLSQMFSIILKLRQTNEVKDKTKLQDNDMMIMMRDFKSKSNDKIPKADERDTPSKSQRPNKAQLKANCFMCTYPHELFDRIQENKVNKLCSLIDNNYGKRNNLALARSAHQYYKTQILDTEKGRSDKLPVFTTRDFYWHITQHSHNPIIYAGEQLKKMKRRVAKLSKCVQMEMHLIDGSIRNTFDKNNYKLLLDTQKEVRATYNLDVKHLLFYDPSCTINIGDLGKQVKVTRKRA